MNNLNNMISNDQNNISLMNSFRISFNSNNMIISNNRMMIDNNI